jgi:hypothetical protein
MRSFKAKNQYSNGKGSKSEEIKGGNEESQKTSRPMDLAKRTFLFPLNKPDGIPNGHFKAL